MDKSKNLLLMLIIVVLVFLYNLIFSPENKGSFLDEMRDKDIKSIITKKYIDNENHNIPFVEYGNKDRIIVYRDWWDKFSVGDSIIKPKNSLELLIKKSDKIERFNYLDKLGLETQ